jgi:hypothetical protein
MKLTNVKNLPQSIVNAVQNDKYSRGKADFSVTGLLAPAFQRRLMRDHEYSEDVSDRIFALLGQSVHSILERGKGEGDFVEERITIPVIVNQISYMVSGQFDLLSNGALYDFKITTTWKRKGSDEWTAQLNMLRFLVASNGRHPEITSLGIIAIYRDWSKAESLRNADYPQTQVEIIPVEMWPHEKTQEFIVERIKAHIDQNPPVCSDTERWAVQGKFAVMKEGRKSAVRLLDTKDEADKMAADLGKGHGVVERPKRYPRCESYCPVSAHCPAWLGATGGTNENE